MVAAKGYVADALDLPEGCESEAFALFRGFDEGIAELRSSWTQPAGYLTIEVRGTDGWLRVETAPWRLAGVLVDGRRLDRRYLAERASRACLSGACHGCERSLVRELEAFAADPATDVRPDATGWDGCRATEMIDAVYRSDRDRARRSLLDPLPVARSPAAASA